MTGRKNRPLELELELIQTHMTQKPLLWVKVGAHAVRKRSECAMRGVAQQEVCEHKDKQGTQTELRYIGFSSINTGNA
jgi:hypothetical protein